VALTASERMQTEDSGRGDGHQPAPHWGPFRPASNAAASPKPPNYVVNYSVHAPAQQRAIPSLHGASPARLLSTTTHHSSRRLRRCGQKLELHMHEQGEEAVWEKQAVLLISLLTRASCLLGPGSQWPPACL
jgi:hypothetical protein